jgi:hypothetical protein
MPSSPGTSSRSRIGSMDSMTTNSLQKAILLNTADICLGIVEDINIDIVFVIEYTWGYREAKVTVTFPKNVE